MTTRKQALAECARHWGKQAAVQDNGYKGASTPEARARASLEAKLLREQIGTRTRTREERKVFERLLGETYRYRYTVGVIVTLPGMGGAFHVYGQGDTWAGAIAAGLERYPSKAKAAA